MDRYLVKNDTIQSSTKKRKRSTAFEECKDNESEKLAVLRNKRQRKNVNYKESSDEEDTASDGEYAISQEEDSDVENTNNSNTNNSNNNANSLKDKQIESLQKKLREMTAKYSQLKVENIKLKKTIKSTPAKSKNSKQKSEKEIAKMKKKYLKKWATRLPKVAGMKKTKFIGYSKEIVVEEVGFDRENFDAIFGDKGRLIQPRPDYKPTSTVIIREFSSWSVIEPMFKDYGLSETITVQIWRNRNFSKSRYYGESQASISSLNVCYNKSRKVLQLKFQCEREGYGYFW